MRLREYGGALEWGFIVNKNLFTPFYREKDVLGLGMMRNLDSINFCVIIFDMVYLADIINDKVPQKVLKNMDYDMLLNLIIADLNRICEPVDNLDRVIRKQHNKIKDLEKKTKEKTRDEEELKKNKEKIMLEMENIYKKLESIVKKTQIYNSIFLQKSSMFLDLNLDLEYPKLKIAVKKYNKTYQKIRDSISALIRDRNILQQAFKKIITKEESLEAEREILIKELGELKPKITNISEKIKHLVSKTPLKSEEDLESFFEIEIEREKIFIILDILRFKTTRFSGDKNIDDELSFLVTEFSNQGLTMLEARLKDFLDKTNYDVYKNKILNSLVKVMKRQKENG
jgi:hypothetical protein